MTNLSRAEIYIPPVAAPIGYTSTNHARQRRSGNSGTDSSRPGLIPKAYYINLLVHGSSPVTNYYATGQPITTPAPTCCISAATPHTISTTAHPTNARNSASASQPHGNPHAILSQSHPSEPQHPTNTCHLYPSDAADDPPTVDLAVHSCLQQQSQHTTQTPNTPHLPNNTHYHL